MFDKELFGTRLRELRKNEGMKQAELAELLGVTPTQIGDMERGNSTTSIPRLFKLCTYFHVSADYLLGITDNPEINR